MTADDHTDLGADRGTSRRNGPTATVPELAASLRQLIGQLRRTFRPSRSEPWPLSPGQEAVLGLLIREGPQSVAELARRERIRPQSMSATVGSLIEQRLVKRRADPADGRRQLVVLTEEGRELIVNSRRARERLLADRLEERLTAGELRTLTRSIELLARIVDD